MSFQTEIEKLARTRRAFLRFALAENAAERLWTGAVDRRYGKVGDGAGLVPVRGTVLSFGSVQRALANYRFAVEVPTFNVALTDEDGEWRAIIGNEDDQLTFRNLSLWLRVLDDTGAIFDQRIAVAQITKPSFPPGGKVQFDCRVSSGNFLGDKIPRRYITGTDWANAPTEAKGLAVPIIYGRRYNDVIPFILPVIAPAETPAPSTSFPGGSTSNDPTTLPAITGTETVACADVFTDNFEGSLSGYTGMAAFSIVAGAGAGGSHAVRPSAPGALLTRTVVPPSRAFCISWSTDSDQRPEVTAQVATALQISRVAERDLVIELAPYGQLTRLTNLITPNTRQTFRVEGAFATRNLTLTLAAPMSVASTSMAVQTGTGTQLRVGNRYTVGTEIIKVTSLSGDVATVLRAQGDSYADIHDVGATIISYDANGYLHFYVDGVARYTLLNDDRIQNGTADGAWTTVSFGPGGDGDDFSIGSGITFSTPSSPAVTTPSTTTETAPYAGDPLSPSPTPDCQPTTAGGSSPSGGAIRAILVGKYSTSTGGGEGGSGGATTTGQLTKPVVTGSVVGAGGSSTYQYKVTAIADQPGAPALNNFEDRNNHVGETDANVVTVSSAPTRNSDFTSSNYVRLAWPLIPGAKGYRVYGRYTDYEPFSLLDTYSGDDGTTAFYHDGEFSGRNEFDILKTDSKAPLTNNSGVTTSGGGGGSASSDKNVYVLAGHALKSVDEVYVLKPVVIQNFGATDTAPIRSEPVQVLQTEGTDYVQELRQVNGNCYHVLVFSAAQVSETCEYYEVTANVQGIETNGDTTGTLIENADDIFSHMMLNWMLNSYRSSVGPYAPAGGPWFTDVPYAPGLWDASSVTAAKSVAAARVYGGYVGAGELTEAQEAREVIREMLVSFDLELYFNNNSGASGAWSVSRFDANAVVGSLPQYDPSDDVFKETFSSDPDTAALFNVFPFFAGPTSQRSGKNDVSASTSGGGWQLSGEAKSTTSISRYGLSISSPTYLKWTQDAATTADVMAHYLKYAERPPIIVAFKTGLRPLNHPLSTLVRVTHPDGLGSAAGWVDHVCKIIRSDIDAERLVVNITMESVNRLMA